MRDAENSKVFFRVLRTLRERTERLEGTRDLSIVVRSYVVQNQATKLGHNVVIPAATVTASGWLDNLVADKGTRRTASPTAWAMQNGPGNG